MSEYGLDVVAGWLGQEVARSQKIHMFQQDSRQVKHRDLFFALKGEKTDGHAYLKEVAERGACGAVVSKSYAGEDHGMVLLPVDDVLASLQKMAQIAFSERSTKVIAVTGSVGKTTTKEFLATLLSTRFRVAKTPGNANSQVGMPLFILNSHGDEEVFIIEMGMTYPGHITKLIEIAPPDVAVVTKVALAHAAYFPEGMPAIARAKAEIFAHPKTCLGVVNVQAAQFDGVLEAGGCPKIVFGLESEEGEKEYALRSCEGWFQVVERGEPSVQFQLPFQASHLCEDFLGACAVARHLGVSWEEIFAQAAHLKVYKNRFETVEKKGITFLNDSQNANPTSMKAALTNLPTPQEQGRTIGVLGEMRELGAFSEQGHRDVAELALRHLDHLLCLGKECQPIVDLFQAAGRPVELFSALKEVQERLFEVARPGDVVLLKGSNALQLWRILEL